MEDMDINIYFEEMAKSVWDKAFFMDKILGVRCVIDFGCADGTMIRFLAPLFPHITFIGYDKKAEFVDRARKKEPFYFNVVFFDSLAYVEQYCDTHNFRGENLCINFSSVLHEVYSFKSSALGISAIRPLIKYLEPKYITIRDMYCDEHLPFTIPSLKTVWGPLPASPSMDFYSRFGPIKDWRDMTHLLMKLQWVNNGWEDELKEDYYSWTIDKFISDIGGDYIPSFDCRYQLPYLGEKWKKEYGWYNPDIHTHAQFILRRND